MSQSDHDFLKKIEALDRELTATRKALLECSQERDDLKAKVQCAEKRWRITCGMCSKYIGTADFDPRRRLTCATCLDKSGVKVTDPPPSK